MKKKRILFLLSASFLLFSCNDGNHSGGNQPLEDGKVRLHKSEGAKTRFSVDTLTQLNTLTQYDDCRLVITQPGCHFCQKAKPFIKSYIEENETVVYDVDYASVYKRAYDSESNKTGANAGLYPNLAKFGTPFYRFYSQGKLVNTQESTAISKEFFDDLFSKYTVTKPIYQRNDYTLDESSDLYVFDNSEDYPFSERKDFLGYGTKRLDALLSDGKEKTVFYSWRRCSDCKNYRERILYPFLSSHKDAPVYYYETDGYRLLKREEDEDRQKKGLERWSSFCQKYHLSDYPNTDILGNIAGYVPTIVHRKEDLSYTLSVFANQGEIKRNDDRTRSFAKAFYPELTLIKSDTKIAADEQEGSKAYRKALKELQDKVLEKDIERNLSYLKSCF